MTQAQVHILAAAFIFFILGAGMIHVTWINPSSRFRPIFCARWRLFGRVASSFGALAQSFTLLSLALAALFSGLGLPFARFTLIPFGIGIVATGIARLGDLRDDEI
ncbi:hypothetical protein [Pseudoxanthomonas sp. z9]|uniref:hypothetical protein n=1 Tax=Pseudoxanthomonas sp. z9 TaxID=2584942 RepID=UPI0011430439|nr:hypothetical protein [Pseudoxanthomonas sp. z9]